MKRSRVFFRASSLALSFVYLLTNGLWANAAETNFWKERQTTQMAFYSVSLDNNLASGLPIASPYYGSVPRTHGSIATPPSLPKIVSLEELIRLLPAAYGTVREVSSPPSFQGKVVIHIQDVHRNAEAQENIGKTLQSLFAAQSPQLVALEGAFSPIFLENLRRFPSRASLRRVSNALLKEHQISGAVFAGLQHPGPLPVFEGIDDPGHYRANVAAYRRAQCKRGEVSRRLSVLQEKTRAAKKDAFNTTLAQFDASVEAYHRGEMLFGDYVHLLAEQAQEVPLQVELFDAALKIERTLDFSQVEEERHAALEQLVKRLTPAECDEVVQSTLRLQAGQFSPADYYRHLEHLFEIKGISLARFPTLRSYFQYALLSGQLHGDELFSELAQLENGITASLIRTPRERELVSLSKQLYLARKLVDFSLTRLEWEEYRRAPLEQADLDLSNHEAFYREAEERDQAMADRLLKKMASRKVSVAVLVTGGFHEKGIQEKLHEAGVATLTFVPRLTTTDKAEEGAALSIFVQEKTPLEQVFAGQKLFLAGSPGSGLTLNLLGPAGLIGDRAITQAGDRSAAIEQEEFEAVSRARGVAVDVVNVVPGRAADVNLVDQKTKAAAIVSVEKNAEEITLRQKIAGGASRVTPEILATLLVFSMTSHPSATMVVGIFFGVRLAIVLARLVHGFGHALPQSIELPDRSWSARARDIAENQTLWGLLRSLVPGQPTHLYSSLRTDTTPGIDRRNNPYIAPATALGGIFANVISAWQTGVILAQSAALGITDPLRLFLIVFMAANIWYAAMSRDDVRAFRTGWALWLGCGVSSAQYIKAPSENGELLPAPLMEKLTKAGYVTEVRGRDSKGMTIIVRGPDGSARMFGLKDVIPKRSQATPFINRKVDRLVRKLAKSGYTGELVINFTNHNRLATGSIATQPEAQPAKAGPKEAKTVVRFKPDGTPTIEIIELETSVVHNGDFDGLATNAHLFAFGKKLGVEDVGLTLQRIQGSEKLKGDTPQAAGLLGLLITQGMPDLAMKLADIIEIAPSFTDAFAGKNYPEIKKITNARGEIFQRGLNAYVEKHGGRAPGLIDPENSHAKTELVDFILSEGKTARGAAPKSPLTEIWDHPRARAMVHTAVYAFLYNDVPHALQMYMQMQLGTSTHVLEIVSTLQPFAKTIVAHGQPITVGYEPKEGQRTYYYNSEAAATIVQLDDEAAQFTDLDDKGGEIVFNDPTTGAPPAFFSLDSHRHLTTEEIAARWAAVKDNPYVVRPPDQPEGGDLVKPEIDRIPAAVDRIGQDFDPIAIKHAHAKDKDWNWQTSSNIFQDLLAMHEAKKTSDLTRVEAQPLDVLLIGEEKSLRVALRFKKTLEGLFPGLNIQILTGNKALKRRKQLYDRRRKDHLTENSVVIGVSDSGQTFSTWKSVQLAEEARSKGRLKNVYVVTGSWYSKMGVAVGQAFHPTSPFGGRILCTRSGFTYSEAPTLTTAALDVLFTHLAFFLGDKALEEKAHGRVLFGFYLSSDEMEQLKRYRQTMKQDLSYVLGVDEHGVRNQSEIHENLVRAGEHLSEDITEPLLVMILFRSYTALTLFLLIPAIFYPPLLIIPLTFKTAVFLLKGTFWFVRGPVLRRYTIIPSALFLSCWLYWVYGTATGDWPALWIMLGVGVLASVADLLFYSFQDKLFGHLIRNIRGRPSLKRVAGRKVVIAGPLHSALLNVARRLFSNAPAELAPEFHSSGPGGGLVHDLGHIIDRNTTILHLPAHQDGLTLADSFLGSSELGDKMARTQVSVTTHLGQSPEVHTLRYKGDSNGHTEKPESDLVAELKYHLFDTLLAFNTVVVVLHTAADIASRGRFFLPRRRPATFRTHLYNGLFVPFANLLSDLLIRLYSILRQLIWDTEAIGRFWILGTSQRGLGKVTTKIAPMDSKFETTPRDIAPLAKQVTERFPWLKESRIPNFLAHIYDQPKVGSGMLPDPEPPFAEDVVDVAPAIPSPNIVPARAWRGRWMATVASFLLFLSPALWFVRPSDSSLNPPQLAPAPADVALQHAAPPLSKPIVIETGPPPRIILPPVEANPEKDNRAEIQMLEKSIMTAKTEITRLEDEMKLAVAKSQALASRESQILETLRSQERAASSLPLSKDQMEMLVVETGSALLKTHQAFLDQTGKTLMANMAALEKQSAALQVLPSATEGDKAEYKRSIEYFEWMAGEMKSEAAGWRSRGHAGYANALLERGVAHRIRGDGGHTMDHPYLVITAENADEITSAGEIAEKKEGNVTFADTGNKQVLVPMAIGRSLLLGQDRWVLPIKTENGKTELYLVRPGVKLCEERKLLYENKLAHADDGKKTLAKKAAELTAERARLESNRAAANSVGEKVKLLAAHVQRLENQIRTKRDELAQKKLALAKTELLLRDVKVERKKAEEGLAAGKADIAAKQRALEKLEKDLENRIEKDEPEAGLSSDTVEDSVDPERVEEIAADLNTVLEDYPLDQGLRFGNGAGRAAAAALQPKFGHISTMEALRALYQRRSTRERRPLRQVLSRGGAQGNALAVWSLDAAALRKTSRTTLKKLGEALLAYQNDDEKRYIRTSVLVVDGATPAERQRLQNQFGPRLRVVSGPGGQSLDGAALEEALALERIEIDRFESIALFLGPGRVFNRSRLSSNAALRRASVYQYTLGRILQAMCIPSYELDTMDDVAQAVGRNT